MRSTYFIITGALAGLLFALFDTAVGNAEVSAIDPTIHDLIGDVNLIKVGVYMGIGTVAGFLLYKIKRAISSSY